MLARASQAVFILMLAVQMRQMYATATDIGLIPSVHVDFRGSSYQTLVLWFGGCNKIVDSPSHCKLTYRAPIGANKCKKVLTDQTCGLRASLNQQLAGNRQMQTLSFLQRQNEAAHFHICGVSQFVEVLKRWEPNQHVILSATVQISQGGIIKFSVFIWLI